MSALCSASGWPSNPSAGSFSDSGRISDSEGFSEGKILVPFSPESKLRLWPPEDPFLYDVKYQALDKEGKVLDEVASRSYSASYGSLNGSRNGFFIRSSAIVVERP